MEILVKMSDRRTFKRIDVNIPVTFTVAGIEYVGVLKDISEAGIAILADSDISASIGDAIKFWGFDDFKYISVIKNTLIYGEAIIVRLDNNLVGCKLICTDEIQHYIDEKKVVEFIKNGYRI